MTSNAGPVRTAELDRVGEQALEHERHLAALADHGRELAHAHLGSRGLDLRPQPRQRLVHEVTQLQALPLALEPADARVRAQALEVGEHPVRAVDGECDEVFEVGVELAPVALTDEVEVAGDHPQRLGHVVRGDVGKALEIVGGGESLWMEMKWPCSSVVGDGGRSDLHRPATAELEYPRLVGGFGAEVRSRQPHTELRRPRAPRLWRVVPSPPHA